MTSSQSIGIERLGQLTEFAELDLAVALHAGVRRAALNILVGKVVHYLLEVVGKVEGIAGDAKPISNAPSITGIQSGTATPMTLIVPVGLSHASAEKDANDLVALLFQQEGGDGTIDTAGHGDNDALRLHGVSIRRQCERGDPESTA